MIFGVTTQELAFTAQTTSNLAEGVVVPIQTLPPAKTVKRLCEARLLALYETDPSVEAIPKAIQEPQPEYRTLS